MIWLKCSWKEDKFNEANKGKGRRRGERDELGKEGRKAGEEDRKIRETEREKQFMNKKLEAFGNLYKRAKCDPHVTLDDLKELLMDIFSLWMIAHCIASAESFLFAYVVLRNVLKTSSSFER